MRTRHNASPPAMLSPTAAFTKTRQPAPRPPHLLATCATSRGLTGVPSTCCRETTWAFRPASEPKSGRRGAARFVSPAPPGSCDALIAVASTAAARERYGHDVDPDPKRPAAALAGEEDRRARALPGGDPRPGAQA